MENSAACIEYTTEEITTLKREANKVCGATNGYVKPKKIIRTFSSSYDLYLAFISYLHKNPSDEETLIVFQIMFHKDITNLPLYINDSGLLGAVSRWRLTVGK